MIPPRRKSIQKSIKENKTWVEEFLTVEVYMNEIDTLLEFRSEGETIKEEELDAIFTQLEIGLENLEVKSALSDPEDALGVISENQCRCRWYGEL
jgi:hypothetical protein